MELSQFEDLIVLHAPDASSVVLTHVLRQAIARFMRESKIATDIYCTETQCGVPEYALVLPDCRQLVTVTGVTVGDETNGLWYDLADPYSGCNWNMDEFHPVVLLRDVPSRDGDRVSIRYVWSIARDGCDVPGDIYERWAEAVKWAALAELYSMPKQEWTDARAADRADAFYQTELRRAVIARWHNYSRRPLSLAGRPFLPPRR